MHNLIILGCGRSGTSMVTGTLATGGYSTGDDNWSADENNPTGYYEERGLLELNSNILASQMASPVELRAKNHPDALGAPNGARWLSLIASNKQLSLEPHFLPSMRNYLKDTPFCFKDPQFSYTLDLWKPLLENTRFICVFRSPAETARSLVRYCSRYKHFEPLNIDETYAQALWFHTYKYILENHVHSGEWFFIHYAQMFDQTALGKLEQFIGTRIDRQFPNTHLFTPTKPLEQVGESGKLYEELCKRANFQYDF